MNSQLPPHIMIMSDGRIKGPSGKWLKQSPNDRGYLQINAWDPATQRFRTYPVHRLVALAFLGAPPSPSHHVRHLNGDKTDNRASNLAWGTAKENHDDRYRHGTALLTGMGPRTRLTWPQVREIRDWRERGGTITEIAERYGVGHTTVGHIVHGRTWREAPDGD